MYSPLPPTGHTQGLHTPSMRFAMESRSQRGTRSATGSRAGLKANAAAIDTGSDKSVQMQGQDSPAAKGYAPPAPAATNAM